MLDNLQMKDSNIIRERQISSFQETFSDKDSISIFGKGPSFLCPRSKFPNELFICINDTINILPDCDIFAANDIEAVERVDASRKEELASVKYILCPRMLHKRDGEEKVAFHQAIDSCKTWFRGKFIIYNLNTSKNHPEFITLPTACNTSMNVLELVYKYLPIKNISTFGIGTSPGYMKGVVKGRVGARAHGVRQIATYFTRICRKHSIALKMN